MTRPIVFLDTETTGIHPGRRVWEVAMIKRDEHGDRESHIFFDNVALSTADPYALRLSGFYERHPSYTEGKLVKGASLLNKYEASRRIERWTRGATIVGLVPNFDTETLDKQLRNVECLPAWDYHLVDVRALALGWLAGCGWQVPLDVKTDQLAALCGHPAAPDDERHTALGDVRWTRDWYDRITSVETDPAEQLLDEIFGATSVGVSIRVQPAGSDS